MAATVSPMIANGNLLSAVHNAVTVLGPVMMMLDDLVVDSESPDHRWNINLPPSIPRIPAIGTEDGTENRAVELSSYQPEPVVTTDGLMRVSKYCRTKIASIVVSV